MPSLIQVFSCVRILCMRTNLSMLTWIISESTNVVLRNLHFTVYAFYRTEHFKLLIKRYEFRVGSVFLEPQNSIKV